MPRFESDWTPMLNAMKDDQFVDMQTRLVIVEMTVYNPSHHLFLVARMGVEFASTGTVHPIAKVDTLRLVNYLTVNDYVRAVLEVRRRVAPCVCMYLYLVPGHHPSLPHTLMNVRASPPLHPHRALRS